MVIKVLNPRSQGSHETLEITKPTSWVSIWMLLGFVITRNVIPLQVFKKKEKRKKKERRQIIDTTYMIYP